MDSPFQKTTYLDFHNHKKRRKLNENITEITSVHYGKNTEYELFTIGKHPWWTTEELSPEEVAYFKGCLSQKNCLGIGEVGLDKLNGPELLIQRKVLESQLKLANKLQKPVIIHCVRAFDTLLKIKKDFPKIPNWCVHGFSRHAILAEQLIHQGFYISLMPVREVTNKYISLLKSLPEDRFFLETDSMPNIKIEDIYLQASKIREVSQETLQKQLVKNAEKFFGYE